MLCWCAPFTLNPLLSSKFSEVSSFVMCHRLTHLLVILTTSCLMSSLNHHWKNPLFNYFYLFFFFFLMATVDFICSRDLLAAARKNFFCNAWLATTPCYQKRGSTWVRPNSSSLKAYADWGCSMRGQELGAEGKPLMSCTFSTWLGWAASHWSQPQFSDNQLDAK